ncbi:MAG: hypothetical protein ACOYOU_20180 [Kiritimatiellia bacterium]
MKQFMTAAVVAMLTMVGVAKTDRIGYLAKAWADGTKSGTTNVATFTTGNGLSPAMYEAGVKSDWDVGAMLDAAVKEENAPNYLRTLVAAVLRIAAPLAQETKTALVQAIVAKGAQDAAFAIAPGLTVAERQPLDGLIQAYYAPVLAKNPVRAGVWLKYARQSAKFSVVLDDLAPDDLAAVLLADEPLGFAWGPADVAQYLLGKATQTAKKALRDEGKSFVVKNGVNPLAERIKPLVDALNAPLAVGLEAALGQCGIQVANQDPVRAKLQTAAAEFARKVLYGELSADPNACLPVVRVALGVEGYNKFIDEYNNGKK